MDADSIQKTLNFTTTYPVLMKLATEPYLKPWHVCCTIWHVITGQTKLTTFCGVLAKKPPKSILK